MKHRKLIFGSAGLLALALIAAIGVVAYRATHQAGQIVYLTGTVTKYDPTPSFVDGDIIFAINGQRIDVGGGMRPGAVVSGSMYTPVAVGDKVTAKLERNSSGRLTIYACASCYVKKQ